MKEILTGSWRGVWDEHMEHIVCKVPRTMKKKIIIIKNNNKKKKKKKIYIYIYIYC